MNTAAIIKNLRKNKCMTQKELGNVVHASVITIQCWENGSTHPSMNAIIALSKVFNVSADYILGLCGDPHPNISLNITNQERTLLEIYRMLDSHGQKLVSTVCSMEKTRVSSLKPASGNEKPIRYIPKYLTPSAAGMSVPLDGDDFEMIPITDSVPSQADFAVKIQGESMLPYIQDEETVFVKRTADLRNGDIGIFSVNGAMYCKFFYLDNSKNLYLVSANPELMDTNVFVDSNSSDCVTCYGKVLLNKQHVDLPEYFRSQQRA